MLAREMERGRGKDGGQRAEEQGREPQRQPQPQRRTEVRSRDGEMMATTSTRPATSHGHRPSQSQSLSQSHPLPLPLPQQKQQEQRRQRPRSNSFSALLRDNKKKITTLDLRNRPLPPLPFIPFTLPLTLPNLTTPPEPKPDPVPTPTQSSLSRQAIGIALTTEQISFAALPSPLEDVGHPFPFSSSSTFPEPTFLGNKEGTGTDDGDDDRRGLPSQSLGQQRGGSVARERDGSGSLGRRTLSRKKGMKL
ncbi:hypothetical protein F5Y17DRAFT_421038, partial [Xylariaceae sp. FL0594]